MANFTAHIYPLTPPTLYVLSALLIPLTMCAHCTVNTHCVLNQCSWLLPRVWCVTHSTAHLRKCVQPMHICSWFLPLSQGPCVAHSTAAFREFNQVWCSLLWCGLVWCILLNPLTAERPLYPHNTRSPPNRYPCYAIQFAHATL